MALVGGMLVMFGILSLVLIGVLAGAQRGGGVLSMTGNGDQAASHQMQSTAAFNVAESGVEYTLQWLHSRSQQYGPPALIHAFPLPAWTGSPGDPAASYTLGSGTFMVWIFPDAANNGTIITASGQETPKRYLIQSTGVCNGIGQTVQAYVSLSSFGKYAFFTDHDPSNIYWVGGLNSFDGPTHFNDSAGTPTNIVWVDGKPIFNSPHTDALSYSGSVQLVPVNSQSSGQQTAAGHRQLRRLADRPVSQRRQARKPRRQQAAGHFPCRPPASRSSMLRSARPCPPGRRRRRQPRPPPPHRRASPSLPAAAFTSIRPTLPTPTIPCRTPACPRPMFSRWF